MNREFKIVSASPEQTSAAGEALGRVVRSSDLLALCGALGAGKTQLVKGLARGLGVSGDEPVVSPTFVLVREYAGRLPLFHVDAYRLSSAEELAALGLDEMRLERGGVVAAEWADRIPELLGSASVVVALEHLDAVTREIRVQFADELQLAEFCALLTRTGDSI